MMGKAAKSILFEACKPPARLSRMPFEYSKQKEEEKE